MTTDERIKRNEECLKKLSKIAKGKYHSPEELKIILNEISNELPITKEKNGMILLDRNNADDMKVNIEFINDLYNWLISTIKKDYNKLKINNYKDFCMEYKKIEIELKNRKKEIKNDTKITLLNFDSIERLKIIVQATKDEYKAMTDSDEKDMVYFNNLLGWYKAIPSETEMFIDSLFEK